ncbi:MAG: sulfotransferase [Hyphomonadaceae bacterium]|nr:sulfotransferase [Hyphomonadaceae bacterium]
MNPALVTDAELAAARRQFNGVAGGGRLLHLGGVNAPDPRLASALLGQGRWAEAEAAYRALLALRPEHPTWWFNHAVAQRMSGRFSEALFSYARAIELGVSEPEEAHVNRAAILADHLRREGEAERELNLALEKNPRFAPALLNLGNLREDQGRREEAIALYERVLGVDAMDAHALSRLANLQRIGDCAHPVIGSLRCALAQTQDAAAGALMTFALGKALDDCGSHDAAFEAYARANALSRASAQPAPRYDRRGFEAQIDAQIARYQKPLAQAQFAQGAEAGRAPVFICGMFRSGSTLVEQIIASHSGVEAGGELPFLPALAGELGGKRLSASELATHAARYRASVAQLFPDADLVTDKRPDNFMHIGLIKSLFPHARIVHTTRAPMDNCLSIYFLHIDHSMSYALDLADIGHHYAQYRRMMAHWKTLFGDDILDVSYDALVRDPRTEVERTLAFCGLDWEDACLSFHERQGSVKTASVWQVREKLHERSSGRWRNYAERLQPLRDALGAIGEE